MWPDPVKTLNAMLRSRTVSCGVSGSVEGMLAGSGEVSFKFIVVWSLFALS